MSGDWRPRVAWFSPLRPIESGIAWYSEEILPVLADVWQLDVFVDGYRPTALRTSPALRVEPARAFARLQARAPYDAIFYQMGNSPAHAYMYEVALRHPGVLVLHDTLLHHLQLARTLARGKRRAYLELMERHYGARGREVAQRAVRGQLSHDLFAFPLSEDLIAASRVVAAHSGFSLDEVARLNPRVERVRIPMGIRLPPSISRAEARQRLGLPEGLFVIASVTQITPHKRLDVVLRAIRQLRERTPVRVLLAGPLAPGYPLTRLIALLGLEEVVDVLGFVDDATARLVVVAADVCVNLRYPTAGETSASLLRLMGAGRAVLVSDSGSFQELPDAAVAKVPVDALEEQTVLAFLERFAEDQPLVEAVGQRARSFVAAEHSLGVMADGYARALELVVGRPAPRPRRFPVEESFELPACPTPGCDDPTIGMLADGLVELGLGAAGPATRSVARALVELGLGPDKIGLERMPSEVRAEEANVHDEASSPISEELLKILACPLDKTPVRLEGGKLVCDSCGRRYRIEDGIPIMLIDEAELPDEVGTNRTEP